MASNLPQSNPIKPTATKDTSMQAFITSDNGNDNIMAVAISKQDLQSIQIRAVEMMHIKMAITPSQSNPRPTTKTDTPTVYS